MFFHVVENTQRDGVKVYRKVKTYKRYADLDRWVRKNGGPVWVIESAFPELSLSGGPSLPLRQLGGMQASYWNTGGWGYGLMPLLPLWWDKEPK